MHHLSDNFILESPSSLRHIRVLHASNKENPFSPSNFYAWLLLSVTSFNVSSCRTINFWPRDRFLTSIFMRPLIIKFNALKVTDRIGRKKILVEFYLVEFFTTLYQIIIFQNIDNENKILCFQWLIISKYSIKKYIQCTSKTRILGFNLLITYLHHTNTPIFE